MKKRKPEVKDDVKNEEKKRKVKDDVEKEINENLKLKMISRMNSISTKMSLTIDDLRLDVLQSAVILKNY